MAKRNRIPDEDLIKLHAAGVTKPSIMQYYGVRQAETIRHHERKLGLPPRPPGLRKNPPTAEEVLGRPAPPIIREKSPREVRKAIVEAMRPTECYTCADLARKTGIHSDRIKTNLPQLKRMGIVTAETLDRTKNGRIYRLNIPE